MNEWLKLGNEEGVDIEVDPNRMEPVQDRFDSEKTKTRFYVYVPALEWEAKWEPPMSVTRQITDMMFRTGTRKFHIKKHGEGKETRYTVTAGWKVDWAI